MDKGQIRISSDQIGNDFCDGAPTIRLFIHLNEEDYSWPSTLFLNIQYETEC